MKFKYVFIFHYTTQNRHFAIEKWANQTTHSNQMQN
jgi:hypothetical protein